MSININSRSFPSVRSSISSHVPKLVLWINNYLDVFCLHVPCLRVYQMLRCSRCFIIIIILQRIELFWDYLYVWSIPFQWLIFFSLSLSTLFLLTIFVCVRARDQHEREHARVIDFAARYLYIFLCGHISPSVWVKNIYVTNQAGNELKPESKTCHQTVYFHADNKNFT